MSDKKYKVTRRQFLNYTLTGVGGFMAAGMLAPMLGYAVDPILKPSKSGDYHNVNMSVDDLTSEPQRVDWKVNQVDGWYESDAPKSAWVYKNDAGEIIALSPICKHLGCFVSWASDDEHPNQFHCPCHGGRYYKDGTNVPHTPPLEPLDRYKSKVDSGMLYLGAIQPQKG